MRKIIRKCLGNMNASFPYGSNRLLIFPPLIEYLTGTTRGWQMIKGEGK